MANRDRQRRQGSRWVGSLDHSDEPDEFDQPERRGKPGKDGAADRVEGSGNADRLGSSAEPESRRAERLGLATLTRGEFYESQRSQADAQEAALRRRDAAASIDQSGQSSEARTDTRAPGEAADSRQANELRTDTRVVGEAADSRSARDISGAATDGAGPSARDVSDAATGEAGPSAHDASGAATDGAGPDKIPWGRSGPKRDAPDIGVERWWSHPPEEKPERDVEIGRGYYWTEVPRFLANWQHIEERWPGNRRTKADGPVSGEGDGRYGVSPERRAGAMEAVDKLPEAEPPISDNVKRVEGENVHGGWLEGYEFRLKGKERLTEKVLEALDAEPNRTPEGVVDKIPDAIRYTFCFEPDKYADGYLDIKNRLQNFGYEMYDSKNWWSDPEYKGINTRWITPEGQRFEVQFHTPESFHAKHEVTHRAYERLRDPLTAENERRDLKVFQREVSSWIAIPAGSKDISDHKRKGT